MTRANPDLPVAGEARDASAMNTALGELATASAGIDEQNLAEQGLDPRNFESLVHVGTIGVVTETLVSNALNNATAALLVLNAGGTNMRYGSPGASQFTLEADEVLVVEASCHLFTDDSAGTPGINQGHPAILQLGYQLNGGGILTWTGTKVTKQPDSKAGAGLLTQFGVDGLHGDPYTFIFYGPGVQRVFDFVEMQMHTDAGGVYYVSHACLKLERYRRVKL